MSPAVVLLPLSLTVKRQTYIFTRLILHTVYAPFIPAFTFKFIALKLKLVPRCTRDNSMRIFLSVCTFCCAIYRFLIFHVTRTTKSGLNLWFRVRPASCEPAHPVLLFGSDKCVRCLFYVQAGSSVSDKLI